MRGTLGDEMCRDVPRRGWIVFACGGEGCGGGVCLAGMSISDLEFSDSTS